jgi:hypothetical protein
MSPHGYTRDREINKMSRCTVCQHLELATINAALARGTPYRKVAAQVRGLSPAAVDRHKRDLPTTLVKATNAEAVSQATNLLSRVETLLRESEAIAKSAKRAKEWPAATAALREARSCLELLGRLRGELQNGTSVKVGVQVVQQHQPERAPQTQQELECAIAIEIHKLTDGFAQSTIEHLKIVAERALAPMATAPEPCLN